MSAIICITKDGREERSTRKHDAIMDLGGDACCR